MFSEIFANDLSKKLNGESVPIPTYSWQVSRSVYDQMLLDHAAECGVEVHQETEVKQVHLDGERVVGVRAEPRGGEAVDIACGHVVDCSGLGRVLARKLNLPHQEHRLGDLALYRYYQGFKWRADILGRKELAKIFFSVCSAGWIWFIALSEELVSVGLVTRRDVVRDADTEELLERELRSVPEIADMLNGARMVGAPGMGHSPRTYGEREWCSGYQRTAGPGYYLASDAAVFVDPVLSSGVMVAHESGLCVANAIHTEWHHPEIDVAELHQSYSKLMLDLWGGFVTMADWWYHKRDNGIEDWYKRARELIGSARGAVDLDDLTLFLTFIAGYLADFRFMNFGVGFGAEGLRQVLTGMGGHEAGAAQIEPDIRDRSLVLERRFTHAEPFFYLATDVDTDRWWKLPAVRFQAERGVVEFRPPVPAEARAENDLRLILRVTQTALQLTDGRRPVEEVVRGVRERVAGNEPYVHHLASLVCMELHRMGILAPG